MDWQISQAKDNFSELMNRALLEGPQRVLGPKDAVILVAEADYQRLTGARMDFKEYLLGGPSFDGLDVARDTSTGRDVAL